MESERLPIESEEQMRAFGASLTRRLLPGDVVLLFGELGAGKSTLVRGYLAALGHTAEVRSPTFNLMQAFPTDPPVLHVDLYRVRDYKGLGIEDYLDSHVCFIEWGERAQGLVGDGAAWTIHIAIAGDARLIEVRSPI